jgi:predicted nucleotidyltransferase
MVSQRARSRDELEPFIHEFAATLKGRFDAEHVILFGSRARGDWLKESDYDFIVVSPKFQNVHFFERAVPLYELWHTWPGAELLCYTPEEYERKRHEIGIVQEAAREGIEL